MPIRTNRGRAAVYRKLWGWPLRSPRHLAVAAVVAAVVITAAGIVIPKLSGAEPTRDDRGGTGATATSETHVFGSRTVVVPPPVGSAAATETRVEPTLTPSTAPAPPEALTVAADWAKAWVDHPDGITPEAWREQLRPFTDVESMVTLESVDPRNVPATAVTGEPRVVVSYLKSVVVEVPTDAVLLRVTVIETDQGWKVSEYAVEED